MRKTIITGFIVLTMSIATIFTGCGSAKTEATTQTTTQTATSSQTEASTQQMTEATVESQAVKKSSQFTKPKKGETIAVMQIKGYGNVSVKFFKKAAPKAVENFVTHAKEGYYDGLTFHRVIDSFMIQGGDPTGTGMGGESIWGEEFENECTDDLLVVRGSLCMANAGPDTNGSQFFIMQTKPEYMNEQYFGSTALTDDQKQIYMQKGGAPWLQGQHTVFGQVYKGMKVIDKIAATQTDGNDKPLDDVVIKKVTIKKYKG
ncbi:MAG: peptidylprolyl isomerase [Lachnospiraceae bacterium]